jgi:hypothetical protein
MFFRLSGSSENWRRTSRSCITVVRRDKWKNQRFPNVPVRRTNLFPLDKCNKIVLIWRFSLVLIKINYGQIGDQTRLFYTTNPVFYTSGNRFVRRKSPRNGHVKIIGYQFGAKFKLVFCAKYDGRLYLGFWEILKPLKWKF